jgi:hypothetical protein
MYVVITHTEDTITGCFIESSDTKAREKAMQLALDSGRDPQDAEDCLVHEDTWTDPEDPDYHITITAAVVAENIVWGTTTTYVCPKCKAEMKTTPTPGVNTITCTRCLACDCPMEVADAL